MLEFQTRTTTSPSHFNSRVVSDRLTEIQKENSAPAHHISLRILFTQLTSSFCRSEVNKLWCQEPVSKYFGSVAVGQSNHTHVNEQVWLCPKKIFFIVGVLGVRCRALLMSLNANTELHSRLLPMKLYSQKQTIGYKTLALSCSFLEVKHCVLTLVHHRYYVNDLGMNGQQSL